MWRYILRRILQMILVLLVTTFIIHTMVFLLPGDPTDGRCGQRPCSPEYIADFKRTYGLDQPFPIPYFQYLGKLLQGDLGINMYRNRVVDELAERYPTTLTLALIALVFITVVGIVAGVIAGIRKGKFADTFVTISTLVVISMPVFVLGSLAQMVFGLRLKWFPVTATDGTFEQLLMPGMVLGSLYVAYVARLMRTSLVENLRADYVRTAKAKGLSRVRAVGLHAFRNSLIPVVTYLGLSFGGLMGGAIVTERIFNINGIGFLIWRSINQRDGQTLVSTVVCLVFVYLVANLIVDIVYGFLDPRISND